MDAAKPSHTGEKVSNVHEYIYHHDSNYKTQYSQSPDRNKFCKN
jgi:hypothetical protein